MAKLIEVKNIDESDFDDLKAKELVDIPWRKYLEIQNYNKDPEEMCRLCIEKQKKENNGRIVIECNGLNSADYQLRKQFDDDVVDEMFSNLNDDEREILEGAFSPTAWFRTNVKNPDKYGERWYQHLILSCSARNKVLRLGRRCIAEYEEVLLSDGSYKQIKDIVIGDKVFSNRSGILTENTVLDVIDNGYKECIYEIKSESGRTVRVTEDHEILTDAGWKSIKTGLKEGSFISEVRNHPIKPKEGIITETKAKLLGYLLSVNKFFGLVGNIYGKEANCILAKTELEKRSKRNQKSFQMDPDFVFSRIKKIHKIEKEVKVYDLTVENDHNFITNGIVTHNCGKTFSVAMLLTYMIARSEKPLNILVAAPQLTMIEEIEKTFVGISDSLIQEDFITRKKKTPALEITFFNGSLLQGITTGTDGTAARGKKADIIWLDETDFIPREALNAIQAIKLDNPNVRVIMTSTPKGEGNLYKEAQQSNVKEFHYPSYVIPHYNDSLHEGFKKDFNEIVFSQEILALYGLDEAGVFQPHHIQDAYEYYRDDEYSINNVLANRQNYTVLIGVDWNHDQNGTRIVITAYDKMTNRFFIVEKKRIAKLNLTQELAVNMVVELNRKYNADHIVCDEGFGIGQVSELRVRGKEQFGKVPPTHPDIKLVQTESIQFGASLTIRDPVTSETLKKNTKQYIVELTQKYLEEGRLALSESKDEELIEQMKNYAVYSKSLRGVVYKPKDKSIGDHDLDAFMLTLFMFDKVYGDYISPKAVEGIGIVSKAPTSVFNPPRSMARTFNPRTGRRTSGFTSPRRSSMGFKPRQKW